MSIYNISIKNGSGWNNYAALNVLKALPVGVKGLMKKNSVTSIIIQPAHPDKPLGISAIFYGPEHDESSDNVMFTLLFDQNDGADWVRERVMTLLRYGIANRISEKQKEISRAYFAKRVSAWRRNFDEADKKEGQGRNGLREKFGKLRALSGNKVSRKFCWQMTDKVCNGSVTFDQAVEAFN